jgi:hypothetical protein
LQNQQYHGGSQLPTMMCNAIWPSWEEKYRISIRKEHVRLAATSRKSRHSLIHTKSHMHLSRRPAKHFSLLWHPLNHIKHATNHKFFPRLNSHIFWVCFHLSTLLALLPLLGHFNALNFTLIDKKGSSCLNWFEKSNEKY